MARLPRYTLRTLLVLIASVSAPLAICASHAAKVQAELAAAKEVGRLGGAVLTENFGECEEQERPHRTRILDLVPCLRSAPYIDDVCLRGCRSVCDDDIKLLRQFRRLRFVDLRGTSITDRCVPRLEAIHTLLRLDISGTQLSAASIGRLRTALPRCVIAFDDSAKSPEDN